MKAKKTTRERKKGPGRPSKGDNALRGRVQVKMTEAEEAEVREAAEADGKSASVWGRPILLAAARAKPGL